MSEYSLFASDAVSEAISPAKIAERIAAFRTVSVELEVFGPDGAPLACTRLELRQQRHRFRFGCMAGHLMRPTADEPRARSLELMDRLFNFVTLPFYWSRFEPVPGSPQTEPLLGLATELARRGYRLKGHPLVWHTLSPPWLRSLPIEEIERHLLTRIRREVTCFRGLIDTWDVVNEPVIMPVYDRDDNAVTAYCRKVGTLQLMARAFHAARQAGAEATLLVNDFDLSSGYESLIEQALEAGVEIDAIGLELHLHQGYPGPEQIWQVCERFARFGKPLHVTEVSLVSGQLMPPEIVDLNDYRPDSWPSTGPGEERQAREVRDLYQLLYSHPAVEAITWWDLVDGGWLGAPSGLLRSDLGIKPAYRALEDLIRGHWWVERGELVTDERGRSRFRAPPGEYELLADGAEARLVLTSPGAQALRVELRPPGPLAE